MIQHFVGVSGGPDVVSALYYLLEKRAEKQLESVEPCGSICFRGDESHEVYGCAGPL